MFVKTLSPLDFIINIVVRDYLISICSLVRLIVSSRTGPVTNPLIRTVAPTSD